MIIFMGVAGSGKSLQGKMLADEVGLPWLSTGEFLRMLVTGERRKQMHAGALLDDKEIIALVQKIFRIIDVSQEFVLDGFPRSPAQADWLLNQVKHGQLSVSTVIHLTASEATVEKRLLQRGRPDDNETAIGERFQEYEETIKPILKHFAQAGIAVHVVNGEQEIDDVHRDVMRVVQSTNQDVHQS